MGRDGVHVRPDLAELRPQILDVGVHGAVEAGLGLVPDQVEELLAAVDAAGSLEEDGEQAVLVTREIKGRAEVGDLAPFLVEREGAVRRGAAGGLPSPRRARLSTALARAASSRGLKGLVT